MSSSKEQKAEKFARERQEDHALVKETLAGDPRAVGKLAIRLGCVPRVLGILNSRMGKPLSDHDIADLSQDILVLIWGKLATFEGRAKIDTWASRFCFREFMNSVRRKGRDMAKSHPLETALAAVPAPDSSPDEVRVKMVQDGLTELGPPESEVIRMKHFEHQTFKTIGDALEISPNTAKTHYYRGIAWLRRHLMPKAEEERT